jgi:hypothetical protein
MPATEVTSGQRKCNAASTVAARRHCATRAADILGRGYGLRFVETGRPWRRAQLEVAMVAVAIAVSIAFLADF